MKLKQDEWIAVSRLLDEALELPRDARPSLVDRVADLDPELRRALRALLTISEETDFLSTLPRLTGMTTSMTTGMTTGMTKESAPEIAPEEIGPYRLIRELGQGGMGSVWLAERSDGILKRQVALKLPNAGPRNSRFLERFDRERDILASLTHPCIARLYDAGMAAGGRPYIALEYVDGAPLTAFLRPATATHRGTVDGVPRSAGVNGPTRSCAPSAASRSETFEYPCDLERRGEAVGLWHRQNDYRRRSPGNATDRTGRSGAHSRLCFSRTDIRPANEYGLGRLLFRRRA